MKLDYLKFFMTWYLLIIPLFIYGIIEIEYLKLELRYVVFCLWLLTGVVGCLMFIWS